MALQPHQFGQQILPGMEERVLQPTLDPDEGPGNNWDRTRDTVQEREISRSANFRSHWAAKDIR